MSMRNTSHGSCIRRQNWREHRLELEEVTAGGNDIVASVHVTARGKTSGVEVDVHLHPRFKVRAGGDLAPSYESVDEYRKSDS
jgi:hypothetical protein